jgi:hypothetical protein
MGLEETIPADLLKKYTFDERGHASAILSKDFPDELEDIMFCLNEFRLRKSHVMKKGGRKSEVSITIENLMQARGWQPTQFRVSVNVDDTTRKLSTHEIDEFKNHVGLEIEWNNKTEFYDRDLTHFRLMHESGILSVGVIITRLAELHAEFKKLGIRAKYGASTTIWEKLIPKVNAGSAGGCPLLMVGIGIACYDPKT